MTLYYSGVNNRHAAEVMELDEHGLIIRVLAHYAETKSFADSKGIVIPAKAGIQAG